MSDPEPGAGQGEKRTGEWVAGSRELCKEWRRTEAEGDGQRYRRVQQSSTNIHK